MKNFIIFFLIVMIICFATPNLFLKDVMAIESFDISTISFFELPEILKNKLENNLDQSIGGGDSIYDNMQIEVNKLENKDKIKLLLKEENKVIELNFDDYIKGVLIGEMPVDYELEALKAQALVARSYSLYKLENSSSIHENADMCDDINCCQCYKTKEYAFASWDDEEELEKWLKVEEAVNATNNQYIAYEGEVIAAFFHANSAGNTEDVKFVWGGDEIPYLKSVISFENDFDQETKAFNKDDFEKLICEKNNNYDYENDVIKVVNNTPSGRVEAIQFGDVIIKATELRKLLGLKSTNFKFDKRENEIEFTTIGYGHGVGMSQVGANQMALDGKSYEEIIKHYYTDVEILKAEMIAEKNRIVYNGFHKKVKGRIYEINTCF